MTNGHRDIDTDTNAVMMVSVETAAHLAGVSVRTIRRWMQQGHLPFVEGERGKLVSPADLPRAKERASGSDGRGHETGGHGHGQGREGPARVTDAAVAGPSPAAVAQLEAIRDEWLRPLVDRIEGLSKEVGRLEAERDALWSTVERLEAERDELLSAQHAPVAPNEAPSAAMPAATTEDGSREAGSFWGRFWRALTSR